MAWGDYMKCSAITFRISSDERFAKLVNVFEALREAEKGGNSPAPDDAYWRQFFDEGALAHFWWPTPEELADWERRWFSTPVARRWIDPSLQTPWAFDSMIEAFYNGEYELLSCERVSDSEGRLTFDPQAWPFGGTGCMKALVEAFDCEVTGEQNT